VSRGAPIVVVALVALVASAHAAHADAPPDRAALARLVDEAMATEPRAGLAVGVVLGDTFTFTTARGVASASPRVDVTPRTTFRLASVTKTFTALAVMQLVDEGVLDLDAEVQTYLPSFPRKPWPVTLRALLSHTSGIGHYKDALDGKVTRRLTTTEALAIFEDRPLVDEPGARFLYSSYGYNVLGAVLEKVTGRSFAEVIDDQITGPLGMTHTALEGGLGSRGPHDAIGYRVVEHKGKKRLAASERIDLSARFAGGGLRSNVEDMVVYARALLDGALVPPDTFRLMTTPTITRDGQQAEYGLGFAVYPQRGLLVVAHAGGQPEASSLLFLVPDEDPARRLGVVLLSNLEDDQPRLSALAASIAGLLLDGRAPEKEAPPADPVDGVVLDVLQRLFSWGIATLHVVDEPRDVDTAFASLPALVDRAAVAADLEGARKRVRDAAHPKAGRVTPVVGRAMARVLGDARAVALRREGAVAFARAYVDACASGCAHPLPASLVDDVMRLSAGEPAATRARAP
jgi:CubicO group peptidase (beta-lactamase class C family)